jgi:hypothetical protein
MLIKAAAHTVVNSIRITEKLRNWFVATRAGPRLRPRPCMLFRQTRVALCKEWAPGALHVRQGQHKGLRIK